METLICFENPPTIDQALTLDLPAKVLEQWEDKIALAKDLQKEMIPGMTDYQIKEFVMGDLVDRATPYGLYQQALREIGSRYQSLLQAKYEYEKNQARLMLLKAKRKKFYSKLRAFSSVDKDYEKENFEAKIAKVDAEINKILRELPFTEVSLKDTVRQLVSFVEIWQQTKDKIDYSLSDHELQKIEWEAKVLLRYFKGKLNYIPLQFDNGFLNDCLELALDLREYGFSNEHATEVACQSDQDQRKEKMKEIIQREDYKPLKSILPLSNEDVVPSFLARRRQATGHYNA